VNTFLETLVAEFDESMNNPIVGRDKSYKPLEVEEAEDDRHLETLRIPLEYWSDHLPAHVQLQLKGKTWRKRMGKMRGLKYSSIQRRSGYQASFLRYWKREGTKRILVGAAHAAEIAYFLKHEIRNPSIPGIAREHIHILETNPQEYATIAKRYMRRELRAALIAEGLSLGVRKTTSGLRRIQRRI
jgi:hypothetical protein